jgi:PilZ domain
MAHKGLPAEPESRGMSSSLKGGASPVTSESPQTAAAKYSDLQSAVRFPIQLPIAVKSQLGESHTQSQNISANGVLFQLDSDMPVGSPVDFTISMPAAVLGAESDVQIDCRGRVVRSVDEQGHRGVGVVIDEYRFERSERH